MNAAEQLIVFVKAPRPGLVKTRMAKTMGPDQACAAYREMVAKVLVAAQSFQVELRFTPDDAREEIAPWLRGNWTAKPQGEGDLGSRMDRAFREAFARGIERVVVIGSDCVELAAKDVRSAFRELQNCDLVVGPAIDGGYWLIGLRAPQSKLFEEIPWSTDQVLGKTLQRAKSLGLRIQLLRILNDVDSEEDWHRAEGITGDRNSD